MAQATPTRVKYYRSVRTVTGWTILFMVVLRVAVGWHFFYEGWWKLNSGGAFSSTPYLMASVGPFKDVFHWMVDDMDGTKKRMTQEYLYAGLDKKRDTILLHYGIRNGEGCQNETRVAELQKKANGGLTNMQLDRLIAKRDDGTLAPEEKAVLEEAKVDAKPLTAAEQAELKAESAKLTKEQVDSLQAFVERKKHGVPDSNNIARLFNDEVLFQKQVGYAGEYVDPKAADKTDQPTVVSYTAIPEKQEEIIKAVGAILADLDKTVQNGVKDMTLCEDQTDGEHLRQLEKLSIPLKSPDIMPAGATDTSWMTPAYFNGLLDARYDLLKKTYGLTDRQNQSRYGWRYRDLKKTGQYDKNNIDFILNDPDFKNDLDGYKQLLAQIDEQEKRLDPRFNDQRQVYDAGKKRDGLRNKLLARVQAPLDDVDLQKIQRDMDEYIGPIKDMTQAQFSNGPVPINPRELEFPGTLLKQAGFAVPQKTLTYWSDLAMMAGLTVIGACLILGLFTRLASLCGAIMLAMFYLAMPPFPGAHVPEAAAEGHYLIVNKNLIEMIVMLMFATSGIGRWFGLDAFIHAIFGRRVAGEIEPSASTSEVNSSGGPVLVTGQRQPPRDWSGKRP